MARQIIAIKSSDASSDIKRKVLFECKKGVLLVAPGVLRCKLEALLEDAENELIKSSYGTMPPRVQRILSVVKELSEQERAVLVSELHRKEEQ